MNTSLCHKFSKYVCRNSTNKEVIDRVPQLQAIGVHAKQLLRNKLIDHRQYITKHGEDIPEILNWKRTY
ncbi:MAG: hypothetical protein LH702_16305 [Phormidesmis sp. CAN_BIN44]|nr:hypothetical protein [Phormidesmis sp. CAN_BIN44]